MKIKKSIADQFEWGKEKFRWASVCAIIALCKETGIDPSVDIQFTQTLIIHTTKTKKRNGRFLCYETETILADRISWNPEHDFFMLGWAGDYVRSSHFLTLDALSIVFNEMKNVIRKL